MPDNSQWSEKEFFTSQIQQIENLANRGNEEALTKAVQQFNNSIDSNNVQMILGQWAEFFKPRIETILKGKIGKEAKLGLSAVETKLDQEYEKGRIFVIRHLKQMKKELSDFQLMGAREADLEDLKGYIDFLSQHTKNESEKTKTLKKTDVGTNSDIALSVEKLESAIKSAKSELRKHEKEIRQLSKGLERALKKASIDEEENIKHDFESRIEELKILVVAIKKTLEEKEGLLKKLKERTKKPEQPKSLQPVPTNPAAKKKTNPKPEKIQPQQNETKKPTHNDLEKKMTAILEKLAKNEFREWSDLFSLLKDKSVSVADKVKQFDFESNQEFYVLLKKLKKNEKTKRFLSASTPIRAFISIMQMEIGRNKKLSYENLAKTVKERYLAINKIIRQTVSEIKNGRKKKSEKFKQTQPPMPKPTPDPSLHPEPSETSNVEIDKLSVEERNALDEIAVKFIEARNKKEIKMMISLQNQALKILNLKDFEKIIEENEKVLKKSVSKATHIPSVPPVPAPESIPFDDQKPTDAEVMRKNAEDSNILGLFEEKKMKDLGIMNQSKDDAETEEKRRQMEAELEAQLKRGRETTAEVLEKSRKSLEQSILLTKTKKPGAPTKTFKKDLEQVSSIKEIPEEFFKNIDAVLHPEEKRLLILAYDVMDPELEESYYPSLNKIRIQLKDFFKNIYNSLPKEYGRKDIADQLDNLKQILTPLS